VIRFLEPASILSLRSTRTARPAIVDVWAFLLTGTTETLTQFRQCLSEDERARAVRFMFDRHRTEHILSHGLLRHVLASYCGISPEALQFGAREYGKPVLTHPDAASTSLSFNLTHSGGRALIAVTRGREVGIDLEKERVNIEALSIARSYFFGAELEAIRNAPVTHRAVEFFRYWSAKEAVIKGEGLGLHVPLDRFHVRFAPDHSMAHVESFDEARIARDWIVRPLPCESGWSAAVAARGEDWRIEAVLEP
jgi:4'-phosphopantetheinyl transferase